MKRLLSLVLLLSCLFSFAACDASLGTWTIIEPTTADTTQKKPPSVTPSEPCQEKDDHTDRNDDGICDTCAADVTVTLDLYAINDLHGKICDSDRQSGVDELTSYLHAAELRDEEYIFLSSGDMWQGSAESNVTKGALATDWMNALGFASMTLGNHEYDWGEDMIRSNAEMAEFPFLAINVYSWETHERVTYCQPSVMVKRGDLKIGIIGAIGDCYSSISSDQVEDVYFKTGSALTALVREEAEALRAAGADYIIYSLHDGYTRSATGSSISDGSLSGYYDPSLSRDGSVDLVFEGHSHQRYALIDSYGVYHLQGGGDNTGISHVEVDINFVNNRGRVNTAEYLASTVYDNLEADPLISRLLLKYDAQIAPTLRELGVNATYRNSEAIGQIVADLYYEFGARTWGEHYDIILGGGFIKTRSPYNLYAGTVIYADLMMILPFDNKLVLCSILGSDLRSKFIENTTGNYYIGYGDRDAIESIDPKQTYYVVVDTYTALYAPNKLTMVEVYDREWFARDLLAEYISAGGLA